MLFASPVHPLLPPTILKTTLRMTLDGKAPQSTVADMLLDVSGSILGNNLSFLGRVALLPIILVQLRCSSRRVG